MRPVNLIPADQRRDGVSVRTGPVAYLIVGALALGVAVVAMAVLTDNKIADRKAEISSLNQQKTALEARAGELQPFVDFQQTEQQRIASIRDLANTRFDWNRVMHELSIIIPGGISLTDLDATSGADSSSSGTTGGSIAPTLQFTGCAGSHEDVASFLASLQDIDGVTDSSLQSSIRPVQSSENSSASGDDCGKTIQFKVSAVFGDAPTASSGSDAAAAATTAAPTAEPSTTPPASG